MTDRSKILDKIEKCMRLSKSSEPHEAAAALRQAQKMMKMHGISEGELDAHGYANEKVSCPIQAGKAIPLHLTVLVNIIQDTFGVISIVERERRVSDLSFAIRYFGRADRVQLACYTHTVVFRAMMGAWAAYLRAHPELRGQRGARTGFLVGWLQAIKAQIIALAITDDEMTKMMALMESHYGRPLVKGKTNNMSVDRNVVAAGRESGTSFTLHRPMNNEIRKIGM